MKRALLMTATLGLLALGGCGGEDSSPAPSPTPPTSGTPGGPTVTTTDFNAFVIQLASQQDAGSERASPLLLDDYQFAFSEDGTSLATVLPP